MQIIPPEIIQQVRERSSIAEIVGETTQLRRSGRNLTALCPFHSEKTPSFSVREEEGLFHCFGCGKKGSIFDFVMETRGMTFPEAVRFLAARAGITIPETRVGAEKVEKEAKWKKALERVMTLAVEEYHRVFLQEPAAEEARAYLARRKVSHELIKEFRLGYAPERDVLEEFIARAYPALSQDSLRLKALRDVGLVTTKETGRKYDTFRGRVLFPITRNDGVPIAVGGRLMTPSETRPKYINSIESPLYSKRKTFYGIEQATHAIRKEREACMCEGYMDVLAMHQAGLRNAVATCGTAVTPDHALALKRLADRLVVVFDGDAAGLKAAASCFEVFLNSGIEVYGVMLPAGEDPSSIVETIGAEGLEKMISSGRRPIIDLYLENALGTSSPTPAQVGRISEQLSKLILKVENPVEREFLSRRIADRIGVSEESFHALLRRKKGSETTARPAQASRPAEPSRFPLDSYSRQLIVALLAEPGLAEHVLQSETLSGKSGLPARVMECVRGIRGASISGINQLLSAYPDRQSEEFIRGMQLLQGLLAQYDLGSYGILQEALRQCTVGGTSPGKVVEQADEVVVRNSLKSEVEIIRQQESSEQDAERRAQLIQEKILKKRSLLQMKRSST